MGDASSLFFLSPNGAVSEDPEAGDERVMAARQTEAARAWRIVRIWFDVVEVMVPTRGVQDLATGVAGVSATDKKRTGSDASLPEEARQFSGGRSTPLVPWAGWTQE